MLVALRRPGDLRDGGDLVLITSGVAYVLALELIRPEIAQRDQALVSARRRDGKTQTNNRQKRRQQQSEVVVPFAS